MALQLYYIDSKFRLIKVLLEQCLQFSQFGLDHRPTVPLLRVLVVVILMEVLSWVKLL